MADSDSLALRASFRCSSLLLIPTRRIPSGLEASKSPGLHSLRETWEHNGCHCTVSRDQGTTELLEQLAAERKARVHARRLESKRRSTARNKEAIAEQHKRTIAKTRASSKYRCEICDYSFGKPWLLSKHLATQRHKDKEAQVAKGESLEPTLDALRARRCVAKAKEEKRNHCAVCDMAFGRPAHLQKH